MLIKIVKLYTQILVDQRLNRVLKQRDADLKQRRIVTERRSELVSIKASKLFYSFFIASRRELKTTMRALHSWIIDAIIGFITP